MLGAAWHRVQSGWLRPTGLCGSHISNPSALGEAYSFDVCLFQALLSRQLLWSCGK